MEIVCAGNRTGGSNPLASAKFKYIKSTKNEVFRSELRIKLFLKFVLKIVLDEEHKNRSFVLLINNSAALSTEDYHLRSK